MAAEKILLQTDRRLDIILLAIIHGFLLSNMLSAQKTVRRSPFFALSPDAWCLASLLHCILYKKRGRLRRLFLSPYFLLLPLGLVLCVNVGLPSHCYSLEFLRSSIEKEVGQQAEIHTVFSYFVSFMHTMCERSELQQILRFFYAFSAFPLNWELSKQTLKKRRENLNSIKRKCILERISVKSKIVHCVYCNSTAILSLLQPRRKQEKN